MKPDATLPERENLMNVLAIGGALSEPVNRDDSVPFITTVSSSGATSQVSLEQFLLRPAVVRASVAVNDVDSFNAYVNKYRRSENDRLIIFADVTETGASFLAVLDYIHDGSCMADRGDHRVSYTCKPTPEWARWTAFNKKQMSQLDFAQFVEDNAPDFVDPSSAEMQEIALTLEAKTDGEFSSAARLQNGSFRLRYNETVTAKAGENGNVDIPSTFTIGIAPFVGFAPWKIEARLRYRINGGKLLFWYELVRTHKVIELAAKEVIDKITTATAVTPLLGSLQGVGF